MEAFDKSVLMWEDQVTNLTLHFHNFFSEASKEEKDNSLWFRPPRMSSFDKPKQTCSTTLCRVLISCWKRPDGEGASLNLYSA